MKRVFKNHVNVFIYCCKSQSSNYCNTIRFVLLNNEYFIKRIFVGVRFLWVKIFKMLIERLGGKSLLLFYS